MPNSIYDFSVKNIDGELTEVAQYKGKVLLIVNTASQCGFTKQYAQLEQLYQRYRTRGFVILAFPCNQFRQQEPADEAAIKHFCTSQYGITFPLFTKINVNGKHTDPLYVFLKNQRSGVFGTKAIKWNFTKFLVNKEGRVIKRYAPMTEPLQLCVDIERLL